MLFKYFLLLMTKLISTFPKRSFGTNENKILYAELSNYKVAVVIP